MGDKIGILLPAINRWIIASSSSTTLVLSADVVVVTNDGSVSASSGRNTDVTCASIVVVTDSSSIDGLIHAISSIQITIVGSTLVVIVAVLGSEDARVGLGIACIDGAFVVVIAYDGGGSALSIAGYIAFLLGAVDVRADDGLGGIGAYCWAIGDGRECASR